MVAPAPIIFQLDVPHELGHLQLKGVETIYYMSTLARPSHTRPLLRPRTRNIINGLLFASPWIIGLAFFWIYPVLASAYYSFTAFNGVQVASWVGLQNYVKKK